MSPTRLRARPLLLAVLAAALLAAPALPLGSCGPRDQQSPEALAGHYEGNVAWRDATLPVDLDVEVRAGALVARVTVPGLLARDVPVEGFAFRSPNVAFRLPMGAETWDFDGWFRRGTFSGTFSGGSLPRTANRATLPRLGLRRVARRADPYATDTVRFAGGAASLAGTVLTPADSLARPAVVLLQGGGGGTRADGLELADRFARAGFVALAFDARGRGASAGDAAVALAGHERDAVAAVEFLRGRAGVDSGRGGVLGAGPGAALAPRVAARARAAFAIAISPPGVPLRRAYARQGGPPEWAGPDADADPAAPWAAIGAPALVLFGERDDVLPAKSAARVREALRARGASGTRVETVARADHALRLTTRPGEPFEFPRFAPSALDTLLAWARARTGLPPLPPRLVPPAR